MWATVLPYLYPILSYLITDAIKGVSERYGLNFHPAASITLAGATGAALTGIVQDPNASLAIAQGIQHVVTISPGLGAVLGVAAAAVHDVVTPPSGGATTPPPPAK